MESILWAYAAFFVSLVYTACVSIAVLRCCGRQIDDVRERVDALETKEIERE
jgi:hypothetical protein